MEEMIALAASAFVAVLVVGSYIVLESRRLDRRFGREKDRL